MSEATVGFVGLGAMGSAMAHTLATSGRSVSVYNRTRERAQSFARETGAAAAETPGAAAAGGIVITMLADDAAVEGAVFGDDGIAAGLPKDGIHISMSTIGVAASERLAAVHAERGQHYLTAPVFGRPEAAAAAKLFIVAAGDSALRDRVQPLFDVLGQRTFWLGEEPAQANLVKLAGNFLITCVIESLAEALTLVGKGGVDRAEMLELLTSTLFNAPVYKTYGNIIVNEQFTPPGFALPLGLKDNRLLLQAAEKLAVPLPFASVVRDRFLSALATGHAHEDWSAIARVVAEHAGAEPVAH